MFIAYTSLFAMFRFIGNTAFFSEQKHNGYSTLGLNGTLVLLLILSFDEFWKHLVTENFVIKQVITAPEFFASSVLSLAAAGFLFRHRRNQSFRDIKLPEIVFIIFIIIFVIGLSSSVIPVVMINLLILSIGILTIRDGARLNRLNIMNYGLLIIVALVICRFFDTDLSFVTRGIIFLIVGAGFFFANYRMLKKKE